MPAQWALGVLGDPLLDAGSVEVMLDIARQWCDLRVSVELFSANDALGVCLELVSIVDQLGEASDQALLLLLPLSLAPSLLTEHADEQAKAAQHDCGQSRDDSSVARQDCVVHPG